MRTVWGRQTHVARRIDVSEPRGTIVWKGTVDDVGDPAALHKGWGQRRSGTHQDAGMEVGGRLAKIVWNRGQHLPLLGILSFNGHTQELPLQRLHTIRR
jgi:hypothetical protein